MIKVWIIGGGTVEKLSPQNLAVKRQRRRCFFNLKQNDHNNDTRADYRGLNNVTFL